LSPNQPSTPGKAPRNIHARIAPDKIHAAIRDTPKDIPRGSPALPTLPSHKPKCSTANTTDTHMDTAASIMNSNTTTNTNTHTMKTNTDTCGARVGPVTTDAMFDDMLMDFDMPNDVMEALNSIHDSDVTNVRRLSTGSDFPSPSTFCPSPATMMGMALSAEMNAEFSMPAVVPDVDTNVAPAPPAPSTFGIDVNEVSVEDLAAIFARDTTGQVMQMAKVLCKAPVKINEKPALKKKRAAKVSVPESKKDAKYYARRAKNTAAAKRNRDLKKQKRVLEKEQANAKAAIIALFSATN